MDAKLEMLQKIKKLAQETMAKHGEEAPMTDVTEVAPGAEVSVEEEQPGADEHGVDIADLLAFFKKGAVEAPSERTADVKPAMAVKTVKTVGKPFPKKK